MCIDVTSLARKALMALTILVALLATAVAGAHGPHAGKTHRRPIRHSRCATTKSTRRARAHGRRPAGRSRVRRHRLTRCPVAHHRARRSPALSNGSGGPASPHADEPFKAAGTLAGPLNGPILPVPPPFPPPPPPPPSKPTNCIDRPSACGYPDATNTGVPPGTRLTRQSGLITVRTPGTTIANVELTGQILVEANNTTIESSDIDVEGTQTGCSKPCGGYGIRVLSGVTGTVIEDVTCHGSAPTGDNVTQHCIRSEDSSTQIKRVHMYNCTSCGWGPGTWSDSFIDETGAVIPQEHYEDIYYGGGGTLVVNHDTMLNPNEQTAVVFASVDFGNQTTLTVTDNLMAGGGYMIYGGGSGSGGTVIGPVSVTGNRFSRLYYPKGGFYGVDAHFNPAVTAWSNNYWDDTHAQIPGP
jgi:hypothetical protein